MRSGEVVSLLIWRYLGNNDNVKLRVDQYQEASSLCMTVLVESNIERDIVFTTKLYAMRSADWSPASGGI